MSLFKKLKDLDIFKNYCPYPEFITMTESANLGGENGTWRPDQEVHGGTTSNASGAGPVPGVTSAADDLAIISEFTEFTRRAQLARAYSASAPMIAQMELQNLAGELGKLPSQMMTGSQSPLESQLAFVQRQLEHHAYQALMQAYNYPPPIYTSNSSMPIFTYSGTSTSSRMTWLDEEPKKPVPSDGVKVGEITAYRIWAVTEDGRLKSYYKDNIWLPNTPMKGQPTDHGPQGVWAFKDISRAFAKIKDDCKGTEIMAAGSVELWGEIVEHKDGYRAQYGLIKSLDGIFSHRLALKERAEMLGALRLLYRVK